MNWFNFYIPFARSSEYIGSEPVVRSTWIQLMLYSCEQENGGVIVGAAEWKDRQWQQTCGVTLAEVQSESRLWKWSGGNVEVLAYPKEKQDEVIAKRRAGKIGGKLSAKMRANKAQLGAYSKHSLEHSSKHISSMRVNGREGEGEGNGTSTLPRRSTRAVIAARSEAIEYASSAKPKEDRKKKEKRVVE